MIYYFEDFELDTAKVELRASGRTVPIEPQVFALLAFLIEHRARVVSKEEIVAQIWGGRAISDAAIASRIKFARHALGDDGAAQHFIRTIHGVGFRFVADAAVRTPAQIVQPAPAPTPPAPARPSIAVLPFRLIGMPGQHAPIAEALPDDLITELSRLRWLFVIARASSFRFRGAGADIDRVRRALNVQYCLSGAVEIVAKTMTISVELCDARDKGVVWSDRFNGAVDAVHEIREDIISAVINALELQIPLHEAQRAQWKSPEHLDAWAAYHVGLRHMYRFTKADNARAAALFERAAALEPGFARAYAGLSFTRFQDGFLCYAADRAHAVRDAQRYAEMSLAHDALDPFGNLAMGRACWIRDDVEAGVPWLARANQLNPNYAQGRYAGAVIEVLLGEEEKGENDVQLAAALSPLDPMMYAMLSTRAFAHIARGEAPAAAAWAERAALSPGAHAFVDMIAVAAHGMNGDEERAAAWAQTARRRAPSLTAEDFIRAFPFRDAAVRARLLDELHRRGF